MTTYDGFLTGRWCFEANGSRLWQHDCIVTLLRHVLPWVWDHPAVWSQPLAIVSDGYTLPLSLNLEHGKLWSVVFEGGWYRIEDGTLEYRYGCWKEWKA